MKKCFIKIFLLCFSILLFVPQNASAKGLSNSINGIDIIEELSKPYYMGRQSGTEGYEKSVDYLEKLMKQTELVPLLPDNSYRQKYSIKKATLLGESFYINNKSFEIMKDYMPFSRCSSGNFKYDKLSYVGAGRENNYDIKTDEVVIINWYDENGKFPEGMLDRIIRAKNHGAKAVLIIADGELKIGNYEHPLNGNDIGIPVVYISEYLAYDILGVPRNYTSKTLPDNEISINLNISREDSYSYNLVGLIKGSSEDKAILLTANLDGFGSLPDGRYFESCKAGSVSPAMLIDLAQYYKNNKPEYNIIITIAGSKWTGNEGIKEVANILDFDHIVSTIDIYAMGGNGQPNLFYTDSEYQSFAKSVMNTISSNDDLGNSLANILSNKTKKLFFIRDTNTWVDNSLTDTFGQVSKNGYDEGLKYLKDLIKRIIDNNEKLDSIEFNYNPNKIKTVYENEAGRNISYIESKYFNVYFDDEFKQELDENYLREIDIIYERISKFNYYPSIGQKIKLLNLSSGSEAAKIAGRTDLIDNPGRAGGGFSSFDRPVIYCVQPNFGTVSHELNHLMVNYKISDGKNGVLEECQGQSFLVYYNENKYVEDVSELINNNLTNHEAPKLIENAKNYKGILDWDVYIVNKDDPYGWQNSYRTLGSIYSFIKYNFGENSARRAIYRNYDSVKDIQTNLVDDIKVDIDLFLQGWSNWMASSGEKAGKELLTTITNYKDDLKPYDYQKIYLLSNVSNTSNSTSAYISTIDQQSIDGNIMYKFNSDSLNNDFIVKSLTAKKVGDKVVLTLEYESTGNFDYSFFDPPNGDILMKRVFDGIKPGNNSIQISLNTDEFNRLLSSDSITMRIGFNDNPFWINFETNQLKSLS